jgi:pyruvate dehydrogenase E2 component (dihydrolipoamide acetyltransferase)
MTDVLMPRLSDSMEEGTILSWLKGEGEHVEAGEELVEIETDKATMTHVAEASGTLAIVAPEGTSLPVGAPIARLGDGVAASSSETPAGSSAVELPERAAEPVGAGNGHRPAVKATPLARRVARAHGVALEDVDGSGPLGRITRADVLAKAGIEAPAPAPAPAVAAQPAAPAPAARPASDGARGDVEVVEPTRLQALIARRMAETKATVPEFQVQAEVVMDAAIAFRAQLKALGGDGPVPSLNDLVVKAAALALRRHPEANAAFRDGRFERYARVNVGMAVATEDALVVPTVFDADVKGLGAIAADTRRLAEAVREGRIAPAELEGATFTVSNLGMFGMSAIFPVLNAGQAGILGVGALRETLARVDGEITDRTLMTLTLTCDHRILYGADAAQLLSSIRERLEQPLRLVL